MNFSDEVAWGIESNRSPERYICCGQIVSRMRYWAGSSPASSNSGNELNKGFMDMAANSLNVVPGYQFDTTPDLSHLGTRGRLSQSAVDGFFAILEKWKVSIEKGGDLLGGRPRSSMYKLKTAAGTLTQDELTRISYLVGIYRALHILLPEELAELWVTQPNDDVLFAGRTPLDFMVREGIPGMLQVRSLLNAARGGR